MSAEHGGGRRAVTGLIGGLRCDLAHHLGAHILELVLELDLLGNSDTVFGDAGSAEALIEHDIAALRAKSDPHGIVEDVNAAQHLVARVGGESDFLGGHVSLLLKDPWARRSIYPDRGPFRDAMDYSRGLLFAV
jgi:hypothetical protein